MTRLQVIFTNREESASMRTMVCIMPGYVKTELSQRVCKVKAVPIGFVWRECVVCREYQKYNAVDDPCKLIQCMPCVFSTNRKLAAPVYSYSMRAIQLSKQNNADSVKSEVQSCIQSFPRYSYRRKSVQRTSYTSLPVLSQIRKGAELQLSLVTTATDEKD